MLPKIPYQRGTCIFQAKFNQKKKSYFLKENDFIQETVYLGSEKPNECKGDGEITQRLMAVERGYHL